ncbi:MAG: hypothetical protein L3I99_00080 [Sulfurimonas sp.]|nr:hypothetical protein [Sulfurimonas sp.]
MSYKVKVQNACRCFLKSGLVEVNDFKSKDDAKNEAQMMIQHMQDNFCKKHEFAMNEQFGDYTIVIKPRG